MNNSMGQKWLISNLGLNWKKTLRGSFVFWWAIGHFETRFRPFEMQQMKFFNSTMGSQATLSSSSMLWSDWLGNKGSKLINDRSGTQDDGGMGSNRVVSRQWNSIRLRSRWQWLLRDLLRSWLYYHRHPRQIYKLNNSPLILFCRPSEATCQY